MPNLHPSVSRNLLNIYVAIIEIIHIISIIEMINNVLWDSKGITSLDLNASDIYYKKHRVTIKLKNEMT